MDVNGIMKVSASAGILHGLFLSLRLGVCMHSPCIKSNQLIHIFCKHSTLSMNFKQYD